MNIRNRNITIALAGLGILGASAIASADYTTSVAQPFRLSIGGFFPSDSTVTGTLRKTALYGGASYDIMGTSAKTGTPTVGALYVDASYNSSGGLHATVVGVGLEARMSAANTTANMGGVYFGAGIGAYFINTNFLASSNHTELGAKAFIGYQITQGLFVEGGYTYIGSVEGVNPGGFMAVIGYKF